MPPPSDPPLRLTLGVGVRQLAKAQTRQRVRDAARHLFVGRGFDDTTTQQVADEAQVAVGTLFQHASDKEDLLLLVVHELLTTAVQQASARGSSPDLLTDLTLMFGGLLEVCAALDQAARPAVRAQWFGTGPNARAVQWLHETFLDQVAARLERAQQAGQLTDGADARLLSRSLSGLYQGVLLDWLWTDDDLDAAVVRLRAAFALQIIPLQTTTPDAPQ
ncbi:TetR/AcrR family transcriptional regulator [Luteitalea sp.]|uniref:TetR/AcrR family transcriptional regulator n=1 Tax=Luteitalea sp. TaxID=2004800 RepID=UPI0025BF8C38|nr:TetR/AcrR family transcriptional regulator [Luteitalea sp.]